MKKDNKSKYMKTVFVMFIIVAFCYMIIYSELIEPGIPKTAKQEIEEKLTFFEQMSNYTVIYHSIQGKHVVADSKITYIVVNDEIVPSFIEEYYSPTGTMKPFTSNCTRFYSNGEAKCFCLKVNKTGFVDYNTTCSWGLSGYHTLKAMETKEPILAIVKLLANSALAGITSEEGECFKINRTALSHKTEVCFNNSKSFSYMNRLPYSPTGEDYQKWTFISN